VEEYWGIFPGVKGQFSSAKIAGKEEITKLGESFMVDMSEISSGMVGIGEAMVAEDGAIIKAEKGSKAAE